MEWKAFGSYYVSNDGKVKRNEKELEPKIVHGYHYVGLYENKNRKYYYIHRLVLTLFKGECPNGYECDHIDRNPSNNHIDNLRWVTRYENLMNRSITRTDITETTLIKRKAIINRESRKKNYIKKERNGNIRIRNNRYQARITVNEITYTKTFATHDEAQAFIDSKK
jgi:hypothetical protein